MKTTTLHVKGMHCNACKLLIEKSLSHLPYIQDVKANIHKGTVQLTHTNPLNLDDIKSVIHQAGYEVVDTPIVHPRLSKNPKDYIIAIISLIIFVVCYGILKTS
ncbi:MAG: heavy-metal-associated domain-containing protein [Candidatus Peribacteria bacterium]|jgi:copper chaperone CopZ|nr:heavy-metal-associated domain-containing protein [Candidatus Peribacteria bacterium]